jgi:hypothetical protein
MGQPAVWRAEIILHIQHEDRRPHQVDHDILRFGRRRQRPGSGGRADHVDGFPGNTPAIPRCGTEWNHPNDLLRDGTTLWINLEEKACIMPTRNTYEFRAMLGITIVNAIRPCSGIERTRAHRTG